MRLCLHALGPRSRFSIIRSIIVELRQNDVTWTREGPMETNDLKSMPSEELWKLREEVIVRLGSKLLAEKAKLEERLRQLRPQDHRMRRPYPKVFPKYQNPKNPTETWSGRGRHPRWLSPQLRSGKKLDDFRIHNSSDHARRAHA